MNDSGDIFFEDVIPGDTIHAGPYVIPADELVEFASAWDPIRWQATIEWTFSTKRVSRY